MATITTVASSDLITNSRTDLNNNFANLNSDKIETSYIDTDTTLAANSDNKIATQKAVKTYVDAGGNVNNASTTTKGIVEEATAAEVAAKTAIGGTGARLFVNPSTLSLPPTQQIFTTTGAGATYTKPTGLSAVIVEVVGGGGGGGGSTGSGEVGGGGGGGGYSRKLIVAASLGATETVVAGAGGAGGTTGLGATGSTSSFGTHATATGGVGGVAAPGVGTGGDGGTGASGNLNAEGGDGGSGLQYAPNDIGISGIGGSSYFGAGGGSVSIAVSGNRENGKAGNLYGGGGSGGVTDTTLDTVGGAGAQGIVIVTEYY